MEKIIYKKKKKFNKEKKKSMKYMPKIKSKIPDHVELYLLSAIKLPKTSRS